MSRTKTKTVSILDIDPFVPYLTEEEQRRVVETMAAGVWTVEMDADRYDELWCQSLFHNADIIAKTEDAMRKGVKRPERKQ